MKTFKHILATALVATSVAAFAQTTVTVITSADSVDKASITQSSKRTYRVRSGPSFYVGFNNFGGSLPAGYDFRPIGSRFVAVGWQTRIPLVMSGSTKLRLITGPEVAWNNFMFEGRNTLVEQNGQLVIEEADQDLRRSKLVAAQLNLPLMMNVSFRSGLSLSLGGYAGMRLDSYTKVKPVGGSAVRNHGAYNLNSFRWGLTTELGYRGSAKLFVRYEPNSAFRTGRGPDANIWAVGVKF
ncbi:outer membrane beta-barrel protein [Spirosoma sp.]|uniref:outer membrane beta-barrel protein n=1 Tax=Spirosoma sp. TaxID=1899569 RepID=UPI003B3AA65F